MRQPRVRIHLLRVGSCRHPEWITLRGGRFGCTTFPSLCVLIIHPVFGPILYDTGYAEHFNKATKPFPARLYRWMTPVKLSESERLAAQLAQFNIALTDINCVLISHLHADHVAGLRDLPNARFITMRNELTEIAPLRGWHGVRRAFLSDLLPCDFNTRVTCAETYRTVALPSRWAPFNIGFDLFGDSSLIAIELPGHSAAQMGLILRNEDDCSYLLAADACWSARAWREQRLPSLLARPLMHDWKKYRSTLSGLNQVSIAMPELNIVPSHCEETWLKLTDNYA